MLINKDTKIYGSFSTNPGNNGCLFFNQAFEKYGINAIYKSFYSNNIEDSVNSSKHLGFSGFAVSSPHKIKIMEFLDEFEENVLDIGSCNTVLIKNGKLHGYNTDWVGVNKFLPNDVDFLTILGDGGFSKSVQHVCKLRGIGYEVINRNRWDEIHKMEGYLFNTTPIDVLTTGILFDGRTTHNDGSQIAKHQANEQFKIYTGVEYE
jgi:shikimate 5-dehydrogenase